MKKAVIKSLKASGIDALIPDEPQTIATPPVTETKTPEKKPTAIKTNGTARKERINKTFPFAVDTAEKLDALAWLTRKEKSQLLMAILDTYFAEWESSTKMKISKIIEDPDYIEYTEHQKAKRTR